MSDVPRIKLNIRNAGATPEPEGKLSDKYRASIIVSSGKGGVGKTTIALLIAGKLLEKGYRVSIIDADVYGPNVPVMLGLKDVKLMVNEENMIIPLSYGKLDMISVGFLLDKEDTPVLWRGPMIHKLLSEFVNKVAWLGGDFLIVDTPPGTGDAILSLSKLVDLSGGIIVTTPQKASIADVSKMINTHNQVGIPILGLVANMAYVRCPKCGHEIPLGFEDRINELVDRYNVKVLSKLPLDLDMMQAADEGRLFDYIRGKEVGIEPLVEELERMVEAKVS